MDMLLQGILNIDKPAGISSARVVSEVKRMLPRGTKIGHAGTLDPFATGVLLLLVGKATKLCERLMDEPKQYEATVKLGATTATDDPESPETLAPAGARPVARDDLLAALALQIGEIDQRPPAFSALKVDGRRAYKLARAGETVQLKPRPVKIHGIELLDFDWPHVRLRIDCGRGTYVRAIARDAGEQLGVGGYLTALRRTQVGPFHASESVSVQQLRTDGITTHLRQFRLSL